MNFSTALENMKAGMRVGRPSWVGAWVSVEYPASSSDMTVPYLYVKMIDGEKMPWTPDHEDLFAEDWVSVN